MKFLSPLLRRVVYPALAGAGVFRRAAAPGVAVLTYHGVLPPEYKLVDPVFDSNLLTADAFRRQIRLLKSHYTIISPEEMSLWCEQKFQLPPRSVLLTCDDGLLNNLTEMLPVLQEERVPCLFFVTGTSASDAPTMLWYEELYLLLLRAPSVAFKIATENLEVSGIPGSRHQRHALWWDAVKRLSRVSAESRIAFLEEARVRFGTGDFDSDFDKMFSSNCSAAERRFRLLTRAELKQLDSAGMTIGAHSMTHPLLSHLPLPSACAEIADSRACLEAALGKSVWAFAYPFGDAQSVSPEIIVMAEQAGYAAAFVNCGGGLGADLPRYAIPRIHVTAQMSPAELEAHVTGFHARLRQRASRQ